MRECFLPLRMGRQMEEGGIVCVSVSVVLRTCVYSAPRVSFHVITFTLTRVKYDKNRPLPEPSGPQEGKKIPHCGPLSLSLARFVMDSNEILTAARQRPGSTEGERNATKIVIEILRPTLEDVNCEYFIHFVVVERKKEEIIWDTPVEFRDDVIEP